MSKLRNYIPDLRHTVSRAVLVVESDHPCIEYSSVILDRGMRCLRAELSCVENIVVEMRSLLRPCERLRIVSRGTIQSSVLR